MNRLARISLRMVKPLGRRRRRKNQLRTSLPRTRQRVARRRRNLRRMNLRRMNLRRNPRRRARQKSPPRPPRAKRFVEPFDML